MEEIKIYGLQRSGTNYLTYLVNENFEDVEVLVNKNGWKHGTYVVPEKEQHVLVIVKNPYSWLLSLYNYWGPNRVRKVGPDLTGVPFEDFIMNKVHFEAQKDVPYLYRSCNPIQHWNSMNFHWTSIRLKTKSLVVVKYESLISNKEKCLDLIANSFGIKRKQQLKDCEKLFVPSGQSVEENWDGSYYLESKFLESYTPETFSFVNEQLDLDLMIGFDYEYKGVV